MPDDAPRHLESLTVGKLKTVAKARGVDVGSCKQKKDYVRRLAEAGVTEEQVAQALAGVGAGADPGKSTEELQHEIETIAGKGPAEAVLPAADEEEVERYIDRVLMVRPTFFEMDSHMETAWNHMIMADYHDAMRINAEVRSKMLDRFSTFQIFSCALAIRAAESILASLTEAQGKADPRLKTALAETKRAFVGGTPRHREETLEELEVLTSKAYEAFFEGSTRAESDLRTLLTDYESFGTQTQEARRLLDIAEQARQSFNVAEYARILDDATGAASRAKEARASEIEASFGLTKAAVDTAREVGAALSVGEHEIGQARDALDDQAFKKAVDLLTSIEHAADQAHLERLKDSDLRTKQYVRVSETIAGLERSLQEAASYGLDVQEGLLFVGQARGALGTRDIVGAAKLARHASQRTAHIDGQLDKERVERGIAKKVEEAKCGKCGREALYSFPNDVRKCIECGHSFSMVAAPAASAMKHIEEPVSVSQSDATAKTDPEATRENGEAKKKTLIRTLKKH